MDRFYEQKSYTHIAKVAYGYNQQIYNQIYKSIEPDGSNNVPQVPNVQIKAASP